MPTPDDIAHGQLVAPVAARELDERGLTAAGLLNRRIVQLARRAARSQPVAKEPTCCPRLGGDQACLAVADPQPRNRARAMRQPVIARARQISRCSGSRRGMSLIPGRNGRQTKARLKAAITSITRMFALRELLNGSS